MRNAPEGTAIAASMYPRCRSNVSVMRLLGSMTPRDQTIGQRDKTALPKLRRRLVMMPSAATVEASACIGPWKRW
jgi:hypothetical protein